MIEGSKTVSIIIPVLNEKNYIDRCIKSIISQDYPKDKMEIIFIDGMSTDGTVKIIKNYMKEYDYIKMFKNPKKLTQYALNIGLKESTGEYIIRMDSHAEFAKDYVLKCIEYLDKTGAIKVGGPMTVKGNGKVQKVIAASYSSPFALGGAKHHKMDFEGEAQAVAWGAFRRDKLLEIGYYDERMTRTEDDDIHMQILDKGGKIYITPQIKGTYYPRSSYSSLFKQFFEYGMWKVAVIRKHRKLFSISHLVPMMFVVVSLILCILSLFYSPAFYVLCAELIMYTLLNAYFSFSAKGLNKISDKLRLMFVHFILHTSYGIGFCIGIFRFWNLK